MSYRNLTNPEIEYLKSNGCSAADWNDINVKENFIPKQIIHVHFKGKVFIGSDVRMRDVLHLSNYRIEDNVVLENVSDLSVEGETTFGNGIKISVLNEGGGRELMMYDRLSSQIAYLLVTCRHNQAFIEKLESIIEKYSASKKSSIGNIGEGTSIKNCGILKNIWIEQSAKLEGVISLSEGTIFSSHFDPVAIGFGVIAKKFIIQSGSSVNDCVLLDNCFIGQGVKIGKQYSAENCAFFANSEAFHGEGVSIFAGPYTVTHHKSSLLIAAMFSFYNAGSGSNQSNHMYKLGPLHQGILDRGAKTGSFSYMLWPSRVGAFSVVIGKHYTNFDASEFPFSYINEEDGKSLLTPAMNMFTVGTRRDSQKWPARDRRKDANKFDILHFDFFNPYIIGKIRVGLITMGELLNKANREQEFVTYKGLYIKRLLLKTCSKYYEIAIKIYIGQEVIQRISKINVGAKLEEIRFMLNYNPTFYCEKWIDLAGMFISKNDYDITVNSITDGKIEDLNCIDEELKKIARKYSESSWAWCANFIEKRNNIKINELLKEHLSQIIVDWRDSSIKLNNMILKDAEKEFDQTSKIGFGFDGDEEIQSKDFENVRGKYEGNKFILELKKESEHIASEAENLFRLLGLA
jgi:hypothetical protein